MSSFTVDNESKLNDTFFKVSVPNSTNQDRSKYWIINEGNIRIFLIADGHGISGEKYAESCISVMENYVQTIDWNKDELDDDFNTIFSQIDMFCKENIGISSGGSTLSICVIRKDKDIYVANVGDSDVMLFDKNSNSSRMLSTEHSPTNIDEFKRIVVDGKFKDTRFNYHRLSKCYPKIDIFKLNEDEDYVLADKPDRNVFFKNVRDELATVISNDNEPNNYITVSRSIGDFSYKEKNGLISVPSISKYPVLKEGEFIICASDGFWDCWKYEEIFDEFIENKETWEKKHKDHAISLFGKSYDDMSAFFIY